MIREVPYHMYGVLVIFFFCFLFFLKMAFKVVL